MRRLGSSRAAVVAPAKSQQRVAFRTCKNTRRRRDGVEKGSLCEAETTAPRVIRAEAATEDVVAAGRLFIPERCGAGVGGTLGANASCLFDGAKTRVRLPPAADFIAATSCANVQPSSECPLIDTSAIPSRTPADRARTPSPSTKAFATSCSSTHSNVTPTGASG